MSEDVRDVLLHTGQFHFGGGRLRLRTLLGSCIAVTLWHPARRIGGMCHYMLPAPVVTGATAGPLNGLYATDAVRLFLREMSITGTKPSDYVVKMFGGGSMFPEHSSTSACSTECEPAVRVACRDVPCKNILTGHELLEAEGFRLSAEDVGGTGSRTVIFEVWSGDVWVRRVPLTVGRAAS